MMFIYKQDSVVGTDQDREDIMVNDHQGGDVQETGETSTSYTAGINEHDEILCH
jgi:hypothetical protein